MPLANSVIRFRNSQEFAEVLATLPSAKEVQRGASADSDCQLARDEEGFPICAGRCRSRDRWCRLEFGSHEGTMFLQCLCGVRGAE